MLNKIIGNVYHVPSKTTANKFLIVGVLYADEALLPGQGVLGFRLIEESRVESLVTSLPRVTDAAAEWKNHETVGVLRLKLKPPTTTAEAQDDARNGGLERTVRAKDMQRDLSQDKDLAQSRTRQNDEARGTPAPEPEPEKRGPEMF
jgi:hypothetical protein